MCYSTNLITQEDKFQYLLDYVVKLGVAEENLQNFLPALVPQSR